MTERDQHRTSDKIHAECLLDCLCLLDTRAMGDIDNR